MGQTKNKHRRRLPRRKKKSKGKKNKLTTLKTTWYDIPDDVLKLIFSRLDWVDRFRNQAVCKRSLRIMPEVPGRPAEALPWIISYQYPVWTHVKVRNKEVVRIGYMFDPSTKKTHPLFFVAGRHEALKYFNSSDVCALRFGWVLFIKRIKEGYFLFVHSPYRNQIIDLPVLEMENTEVESKKATFSSDPTSPDCVFAAFFDYYYDYVIDIRICRTGDKRWTKLKVESFHTGIIKDVTYADGFFYCYFQGGWLSAFHIVLGKCTSCTFLGPGSSYDRVKTNLVASDKGLLLVREGKQLWRVNLSKMNWVREGRLGARAMIFLGCTSYRIEATEEVQAYAKKVFCEHSSGISFSNSIGVIPDKKFWIGPPCLSTRLIESNHGNVRYSYSWLIGLGGSSLIDHFC